MTPEDQEALERLCGHRFKDPALLLTAITHRSFTRENPEDPAGQNERLEFLGDAVIGLVAAEHLHEALPDADEGHLTRCRAHFVSRANLADVGRRLGLGQYVRLGRGEMTGREEVADSILSNAVEALIGAVYLDGGLKSARNTVHRLAGDPPLEVHANGKDAKSALQELFQGASGKRPSYEVESREGPDHAPHFEVAVHLGATLLARGAGSSKKAAEQDAAARALARYEGESPERLRALAKA
jgi:ribonuclease-3